MNPYQRLLDTYVDLEAREHVDEIRDDMGIPWTSCNPGCGCSRHPTPSQRKRRATAA